MRALLPNSSIITEEEFYAIDNPNILSVVPKISRGDIYPTDRIYGIGGGDTSNVIKKLSRIRPVKARSFIRVAESQNLFAEYNLEVLR